jgi:hypothetical protein
MKSTKVLSSQQTTGAEETEAIKSQYNYISDVIGRSDSMHSVYAEIVDLTEDGYLSPIDARNFTNEESEREVSETALTENHRYVELGETSQDCPYDSLRRPNLSEVNSETENHRYVELRETSQDCPYDALKRPNLSEMNSETACNDSEDN